MIYGVILKQRTTGKLSEYWFTNIADREKFINRYDLTQFQIVEYLGDQAELNI
jgi:hypothetical protein